MLQLVTTRGAEVAVVVVCSFPVGARHDAIVQGDIVTQAAKLQMSVPCKEQIEADFEIQRWRRRICGPDDASRWRVYR